MSEEIIMNEEINEESKSKELYENRNNISRYKVREQTMLLTFERLFHEADIDEIADNVIDSRDVYYSDEAIKYAKLIDEMKNDIDKKISEHLSKGWRISRISKTSLAIMRVAVYEMCYLEEVPVSVAINEAVELAKKYTPDDSKFVNGVLGAVAQEEAE